ncbi:hypothetical protein ACIBG8_17255 [Nonomuraea sp. NPDC050556]|uniref:hypothetical protein n=1 Tax=Nonomuraea sp. NPDC050556 TaxID=3364369 RepID=UPI003788F2D5
MIKYLAAVVGLLITLTPLQGYERWDKRWDPSPRRDGLSAFEGLEDDRRGSDPEHYPHIFTEGDAWKFTMFTAARDGADRQRNEVRGMRDSAGKALEIRKDETWRLSWKMYIPDTLDATSNFTHIWQVKTSDTGTPVMQLTLPIKNGVPSIEARYWTLADNQVHPFADTPLEPIQNRWVTTTVEWKSSDAGYMRWTLQDGYRTLVDQRVDNIDLNWSEEQYNRPKWGIYRSIKSTGLQDTYLLIKDLRAWTQGPVNPPVQLPAPAPGGYEAERVGNVFEGAAEPVYCRICSGGRKVLLIGGNTYDYTVVKGVLSETTGTRQMTIHAVVDGAQTFRVSVNGENSFDVPMTGVKDQVSTVTVPVNLIAGVNQIRFFNLAARSPELDRIVIS